MVINRYQTIREHTEAWTMCTLLVTHLIDCTYRWVCRQDETLVCSMSNPVYTHQSIEEIDPDCFVVMTFLFRKPIDGKNICRTCLNRKKYFASNSSHNQFPNKKTKTKNTKTLTGTWFYDIKSVLLIGTNEWRTGLVDAMTSNEAMGVMSQMPRGGKGLEYVTPHPLIL